MMDRRTIFETLLLALCWGPSYMCIKIAIEDVGPLAIACIRCLIGGAILMTILKVSKQGFLSAFRQHWRPYLTLGILANGIPFFLINWAELHISSATAAIMMGVVPVMTAVMAHYLLATEALTRTRAVGIGLGLVGFLMLLAPTLMDGSVEGDTWGVVAMATGCLSLSFGMIYGRNRIQGHVPMQVAAGQLTLAGIALFPLWIMLEGPIMPGLPASSAILFMGVVGTGCGYLFYNRILARAGATALAMSSYLLPVIGILLGVVFLGETLTTMMLVATGVILCGMLLVNRKEATS